MYLSDFHAANQSQAKGISARTFPTLARGWHTVYHQTWKQHEGVLMGVPDRLATPGTGYRGNQKQRVEGHRASGIFQAQES